MTIIVKCNRCGIEQIDKKSEWTNSHRIDGVWVELCVACETLLDGLYTELDIYMQKRLKSFMEETKDGIVTK